MAATSKASQDGARTERWLRPSGGQELGFDSSVRLLLALFLNLLTLLKLGWREPILPESVLYSLQIVALAGYGLSLLLSVRAAGDDKQRRAALLSVTRPEQIATLIGLVFCWSPVVFRGAAGVILIIHFARLFTILVQTRIPTGLVFLGSFVLLTLGATGLLMLPASTPTDQPIRFVDALFTITSAISQTGLTMRPTGEGFTRFGQVVILIAIQVGALGVIVFGALLVTLLGSSFGLRATQTLAEGTEQGWAGQLAIQRLVTFIIIFTHSIEAVGAALLFIFWPESWFGMPKDMVTTGDRLYHSVFFAISSFCNAGFSTTSDSLVSLRGSWTTHVVVGGLIALGTIGFPVLDNLREVLWKRLRGHRTREGGSLVRLTLHSKLMLSAFFVVTGLGAVITAICLWAFSDYSAPNAALQGVIMSINRTAGFNTVEFEELAPLGQLTMILLMAIGGAPISAAGGLKFTVLVVLVLTVWATILGRGETTAFGRSIPDQIVRKCATIATLWVGMLFVITAIVTISDPEYPLLVVLYDTTSALSTCGLSSGMTGPDLSTTGKVTLIVAMFVGRVGPFAVLAALVSVAAGRRSRVHYPSEQIAIY